MSFPSDYPGAIVVEAANYGYGSRKNNPKGWIYHTPEEIADADPTTPRYLAGTTRLASYTYFVSSWLALVFQLVPEHEGAYANYVNGKPYPSWADPSVNLNLQGISVSFEGMAATIHLTMPRGGPQWTAGVDLVAHRAKALNIDPDSWARHSDVSVDRGDPGQLDIDAFTADVKAKIEEDDMKLLFYRYGSTIYIIRPDGKRRRISLPEWDAHAAAGATYIQVNKDPSKIARA